MNSNDELITLNDTDRIIQRSPAQSRTSSNNKVWTYAATDQQQNNRLQVLIKLINNYGLSNDYRCIVDCSLLHACIGTIQEGLLILDLTGNIVFFNQSADEILRIEENGCKSIYETKIFDAFTEDNLRIPEDTHPVNISIRDGIALHDIVIGIQINDENLKWLTLKSQPIYYGNDQLLSQVIVTFVDITSQKDSSKKIKEQQDEIRSLNLLMQYQMRELEKANEQIDTLAIQDELTGLKNYRAFHERLNTEVIRSKRYKTPLSIIILDVDRFKEYNDKYGRPAGDRVLKQIADILLVNARNTDIVSRFGLGWTGTPEEQILVARNGGEEFSLILPHTDIDGAMNAAERFRHAINKASWELQPVTASFGVASLIHGIDNASSLMAAAEQALYRSKFQGRNRVNSGNIYSNNA